MWRYPFLICLCVVAVWLRRVSSRAWPILSISFLAILLMTLTGREALPGAQAILEPFHAFAAIWLLQWRSHSQWTFFGLMGNVVLFVPLGLGLSGRRAAWRKYLAPLLISISVEYVQYHTLLGTFEVDDIICNAVGGILGYELGRCLGGEETGSLVVPAAFLVVLAVCCAKSVLCN